MWREFAIVAVFVLGCSRDAMEPPKRGVSPESEVSAPFRFSEIARESTIHTWGPQVVLRLMTTVEVARGAEEPDLRDLWEHLEPEIERALDQCIADHADHPVAGGDRRVFVYLYLNADSLPWAHVSRLDGELDVVLSKDQVPELTE